MNLAGALGRMVPRLGNELVVHANGYISRQSFQLDDRPANFYMIGSMGLASSIGLGLALNKPERRVVIFDGDGNLLMNLGSLALIGAMRPANLLHVVFDNEVYGSTGNQPTISGQVALEEMARAAGYPHVARVARSETVQEVFTELLAAAGPAFLLVKIEPDRDERKIGRVSYDPPMIARRFQSAIVNAETGA